MLRSVAIRGALFIAAALAAVIYLTPTFFEDPEKPPSWWPAFLPKEPIRRGLDLQGGTHLVLEVKVDKAIENTIERMRGELVNLLRERGVSGVTVEKAQGGQLHVKAPAADAERVRGFLKSDFPNLAIVNTQTSGGTTDFFLTLSKEELRSLRDFAVDQSLETIRNRIDQFGVSEPTIVRQGQQDILVQLPGVQDPERAKAILGKTALLEFKLVDDTGNVEDALRNGPPPGRQILYGLGSREGGGLGGEKIPYLVESRTLMTGEYIVDARVRPATQMEGPYVELILNSRGARLFEEITAANVKRRLAIVLDNSVYSAPVIQERIGGGRASITGSFNIKEARDLAIILRAGALPAPVEIVEERTVGPSLGRDSIEQGIRSFIVGGAVVVLFVVTYYKGAGVGGRYRAVFQCIVHDGDAGGVPGRAHFAGHRRHRAHRGHGGGCQRVDQRTHARRAARGTDCTIRRGGGLSKCAAGDPGLQRHDLFIGRHFVPVRHRPDQRIRGDPLRRYYDDGAHRRVSHAGLL